MNQQTEFVEYKTRGAIYMNYTIIITVTLN